MTMDDDFEVEEGAELYMHTLDSLPENCKKYWPRRYMLFSKFDEGVYMTSELWYSVTPEDVAVFTAKLVKELMPETEHILDICCGGGGNSIQFGKHFKSVGAVDINKHNLACTEHNASIYGVLEHIWVHLGDWNEMAPIRKPGAVNKSWIPKLITKSKSEKPFDLVFSSPPWGGPLYKDAELFDLFQMEPFSVKIFCKQILQYTDNFILFLPRNLDLDQLREVTLELMGPKAKCRILYIEQFGKTVALLALFGEKLTTGDINYERIFPEDLDEGALVVKAPGAV